MKDNQPKTDSEILFNVTKEAMLAAGARAPVVSVFTMLQRLQNAYGERFSIDGACNALDSMVRAAELAKRELIEAKRKEG
jgi:hypothetical protein